MIRPKEGVTTSMQMEQYMMESGMMTSNMERVLRFGQTEQNSMVALKMEKRRA
jgi:hypothetical protein